MLILSNRMFVCVAVCCGVLQCVAVCGLMLKCVAVSCRVLREEDDASFIRPNILVCCKERWGAGVETQKNVRGEIGGWGQVPFNETYAPSLSTIYDGA